MDQSSGILNNSGFTSFVVVVSPENSPLNSMLILVVEYLMLEDSVGGVSEINSLELF